MKYLMGITLVLIAKMAIAEWIPPENPQPSTILSEARDDAVAGKYEDALAKHLWFHNNALKYQRALYGVRLSFALRDWSALADKYPPALVKMKEVRDNAEKMVRNGTKAYDYFHDFESLNQYLDNRERTVELFLWLEKNNQKLARKVYRIAQQDLLDEKKYEIAAKYIDSQSTYGRIVGEYNSNKRFLSNLGSDWDEKSKKMFERYGKKSFTHSTEILVVLLALSDRDDEAKDVSEQALMEIDNKVFRHELESALNGIVPKAWP